VDLPDSLPAQLYLLTYNPESERMAGRHRSGYLGPGLRAAAVLELERRGRVAVANGKVVPVDPERRPAVAAGPGVAVLPDDPILTRVLDQIEGSGRHRSLRHWIAKDNRVTTRCARDYLEAGRWLRVDRYRVIGLIPRTSVTVRDTRLARKLIGDVRQTLVGASPAARVADRDRQLAALGLIAEMGVLFSRRERRAHRDRARELAAGLGPVGEALRKVVRDQKADAAATAGGG
jgi:hypothetical protein